MVLLLLVGGAIVNVAVAWGSAWAFTPTNQTWGTYGGWHILRRGSFTSSRLQALRISVEPSAVRTMGRAPHLVVRTFPAWTGWPDELDPNSTHWHAVEARGWPFLALRSEHAHRVWISGIALPRKPGPSHNLESIRSLPVRMMWPGFAINTMFYAAILWLLFAAPLALRRWRRIKRGLCVKCAYPVHRVRRCGSVPGQSPGRTGIAHRRSVTALADALDHPAQGDAQSQVGVIAAAADL